jgi:hypothetical protein
LIFDMRNVCRIAFLIGSVIFLVNCSGGGKKQEDSRIAASKLPTLTLQDSADFDFGTINEGQIVEHTFNFKNNGVYPLIINNITSSCGCTTPEWPRDPVVANAVSSIKVRFDSKNKTGPQAKTITVYANTEPSTHELRLKGIVNAAPKAEPAK